MPQPKDNGFIATVKLGPKGQIVIPKEVRDMFDVGPGDSLVLMADPERGIALHKQSVMLKIAQAIMSGSGQTIYPNEDPQNLEMFAAKLRETAKEDSQ